MATSRADDAAPRAMVAAEDLARLRALLAHAPAPIRRRSLLEALESVRDELPQSLFLAWLLSPQGPLTGHWLLRQLLQAAAPQLPWPGEPLSVLPEVEQASERPDIVATWDHYTLIIEYKVHSPEGPAQIARYLKTFSIDSADKGMVLFVSPEGRRPCSVDADDPRVCAMSFGRLIELIEQELAGEPSERGRVLAGEYRDCLKSVLHRSLDMDKPVITEATKLLTAHYAQLDRLRADAVVQAAEFIHWMMDQAEQRLRPILGKDMVVSRWEAWGVFLFRRPQWCTQQLEYGITYVTDARIGGRLLHEYGHAVGVRVDRLEREAKVPDQAAFSRRLAETVLPHWPQKLSGSNQWFAFWQEIPLPTGGDWDAWAEGVWGRLEQLARTLAPVLDDFAAGRPAALPPAAPAVPGEEGDEADGHGGGEDDPYHWDEQEFMREASGSLGEAEMAGLRRLCRFSQEVAGRIEWKTLSFEGGSRANVLFAATGPRPLYRFCSDGRLWMDFAPLDRTEEARALRRRFARELARAQVCRLPAQGDEGQDVLLEPAQWLPQLEAFQAVVRQLLAAKG